LTNLEVSIQPLRSWELDVAIAASELETFIFVQPRTPAREELLWRLAGRDVRAFVLAGDDVALVPSLLWYVLNIDLIITHLAI
jgi:hypothetical protein